MNLRFPLFLLLVALLPLIAWAQSGSLQLDKQNYAPGEEIQVRFTAPANWATDAWIGIVPSNVPHGSEAQNDQHDIAYQYLQGRTQGILTFRAPDQPGRWDMRLHDTDAKGLEIASFTFTVGYSSESKLTLEKNVFSPGEEIRVHFIVAGEWPEDAWIGIIPSNVPHGSEVQNDQYDYAYQHLQKRTSGTLTFKAPDKPGQWDMRMNDTDVNGREIDSVTFTVR